MKILQKVKILISDFKCPENNGFFPDPEQCDLVNKIKIIFIRIIFFLQMQVYIKQKNLDWLRKYQKKKILDEQNASTKQKI
jgi:hypothetical protein